MINKLLTASAAFMMLASSVTPSLAIGPGSMAQPLANKLSHIKVAQPVLAPFGFVSYCVQNQDDCKPAKGPETIEWSYAKMRELRQINYRVNKTIKPVNDASGDDRWDAEVAQGDCEDYVLTKRKELINQGWPARSMRIAVAYTPNNEGHAVLIVRTSRGDLVLDNRTNSIINWRESDLRWVMLQSGDNPLYWNAVQNG